MLAYIYDKSFEGLLSAIFDAYFRHESPSHIIAIDEPLPMFTNHTHIVETSEEHSSRVWRAVKQRTNQHICNMLAHVWLSEEAGSDELIFRYMQKIFDSPTGIEFNFTDNTILTAKKLARKVSIEAERLRQFIRFQKTTDNTYFAPVAPQHNALPLTIDHFRSRFGDQKWIIYDTRRHYGYSYDLTEVKEIFIDHDDDITNNQLPTWMLESNEKLYQKMWKEYYKALTIKERLNKRQQRAYMPVRYWTYLTELQ